MSSCGGPRNFILGIKISYAYVLQQLGQHMDDFSPEGLVKPTVLLVHGTWPRGILSRLCPDLATSADSAWFDEGSSFRAEMAARLGDRVSFEAFIWSGHNSMKARREAAAALHARLQALRKSSPGSKQLVVAHSHGGNVALQAIAQLDSRASILGVATLATPFLYLEERQISAHERGTFNSFAVTALLALMAPFAWLTWAVWDLTNSLGAFLTVLLGVGLWCLPLALWTFSIAPKLSLLLENTLSGAAVPIVEVPVLTLRCPSDEASLALGLARTFAVTNHFVWKVLSAIHTRNFTSFAYFAVAWIVLTGFAVMTETIDHSKPWVAAFLLWPVGLWLLAIPGGFLASVLFSATSGFLLLPFGAELWALAFKLKVKADAKPPAAQCMQVRVRPEGSRLHLLRHSVYEVAAAREKLAEWISERVSARD